MAAPREDCGASVNAWVDVVRHARLDRTTKLVALMMASRANPDGTSVRPGIARLVVECRIGYGTVRDSLALLRHAGLLERVRRGNRRRGHADEYRLILAPDLFERIAVSSPDEQKAEIKAVAARTTAAGRKRQEKMKALALAQTGVTAGPVRGALALAQASAKAPISAGNDPGLALTPGPPPSIESTLPEQHPPGRLLSQRNSLRRADACDGCDVYLDPDGLCRNRDCSKARAVAVP